MPLRVRTVCHSSISLACPDYNNSLLGERITLCFSKLAQNLRWAFVNLSRGQNTTEMNRLFSQQRWQFVSTSKHVKDSKALVFTARHPADTSLCMDAHCGYYYC